MTGTQAQFKDTVIVEFQSGEPLLFLQSTLPCRRPTSNPNVTNHIQCLSDLYLADKGSSLTQIYLPELRDVAKLSGSDFEKVLSGELTRIRESTDPQRTKTSSPKTPVKVVTDETHSHEHDSISLIVGAEAVPSPKKPGI